MCRNKQFLEPRSCLLPTAMLIKEDKILNPNIPNLPSKEEVVTLSLKKGYHLTNYLIYTSTNSRKFFIKYANATMAEAHT